MVVELRNYGSPVSVVNKPRAPCQGNGYTYSEMIARVTSLDDYRFATHQLLSRGIHG